jgi:NitT/TauT family transport system substrate-binding protein
MSNTSPARGKIAAVTVAVALALAACGSGSGNGDGDSAGAGVGSDPLVYNVGSALPTVVMGPYAVVPAAMGFWEDAGVDVDVEFADGSTAGLQLLLSGRADISVSGIDAVYSTAEQNSNLRVVSLTPENVWRFAVPESSDIDSVDDLKGQKIGVISLTSGSYTYGRSIVQSAGLDPDKDVEWLPIGTGTQAAEAVDSGRVAAYSSYDGPLDIVGTVTKEELRALPSKLDEVSGSLAYVTTKEVLEERGDDIIAFLKGTYQGMAFSLANPEAAIKIYWEAYPDQAPAEGDADATLATTKEIVKNAWSNRFSPGDENLRGYLTDEHVKQAADFFAEYQITEGSADVSTVVDLSLNEEANDFDVAEVEEQAEGWKP